MLKQQHFTSKRFSSLISETADAFLSSSPAKNPIFAICDKCYWCATYLANMKRLAEHVCPLCDAYDDDNNNNIPELSLYPLMSNESKWRVDLFGPIGDHT